MRLIWLIGVLSCSSCFGMDQANPTRGCVSLCCLEVVAGSSVTVPIDPTRSSFLRRSFHHLLAKTLLQWQETGECSVKFIQQENKHPKLTNATPVTILEYMKHHIDLHWSLQCTVNVHRDSWLPKWRVAKRSAQVTTNSNDSTFTTFTNSPRKLPPKPLCPWILAQWQVTT